MIPLQDLAIDIEGADSLIFDEEICYYALGKGSWTFYVNGKGEEEWWNHAMKIFACPFCPATVGGWGDEDIKYSKKWMGKHLAVFHSIQVKDYLEEQRIEHKEYCDVP